jgi:hypothetical protein
MKVPPIITLDTNCIIALEKHVNGKRPNAREQQNALAVQELMTLHKEGVITLQTTLCSALEQPLRGEKDQELFEQVGDMAAIGLGGIDLFQSPRFMGFPEGNAVVFDMYRERAYQQAIHQILSPSIDLSLPDYQRRYCREHNLDAALLADIVTYQEHLDDAFRYDPQRPERLAKVKEALAVNPELLSYEEEIKRKWWNAFNDSYGLCIHVSRGGDIFVTDDGGFYKPSRREGLRRLVPGKILRPQEAVQEMLRITGAARSHTTRDGEHIGS